MNIPLRECFKKLPIIAVGCLLHSLFKIQLAGECPIVITTYCDNPHTKGKMDLELGDGLQWYFRGDLKMYDPTAFVFRIVVLLIAIVKYEGRGKEWMEMLKHASWRLDEYTFSCYESSDSDFPFLSMHLSWLPLLCLSFYPFLPVFLLAYTSSPGQRLLSVGPCTQLVHCKNTS